MVKKKTHKLVFKPVFDFQLIGLASDEQDYRISWLINSAMGWKLSKRENLVVEFQDEEINQEFSLFTYTDEETLVQYNLVANRTEHGYLLDEIRNIDYLLQVIDETGNQDMESLVTGLKKLKEVRACFIIDPGILKSRDRLVF
jgi:hypothetical protein